VSPIDEREPGGAGITTSARQKAVDADFPVAHGDREKLHERPQGDRAGGPPPKHDSNRPTAATPMALLAAAEGQHFCHTPGAIASGPAVGLSLAFVATRIGARTRDSRCDSADLLGAGVISVGCYCPRLLVKGDVVQRCRQEGMGASDSVQLRLHTSLGLDDAYRGCASQGCSCTSPVYGRTPARFHDPEWSRAVPGDGFVRQVAVQSDSQPQPGEPIV
ncbi:unnamed protein product, partial [Ectocarpus sp. 8 AP-2014]